MQPPRVALGLILLLLLVLASGYWLWGRLTSAPPPQPSGAPPTTAATPTAPASPTPTPVQAPPGYRLAGVAVGEPVSYAVVEAPNGVSTLYHLHESVPGLGRLVRIEAERVVVEATGGQFELWLMPAATPTTGSRAARLSTRVASAAAATPRLQPQPADGGTAPQSTPSGAPDRPAS
ncbi:MAG TPA: hypothetical protein VN812_19695 [Candidatus Acidoferrales bacterium]|nr:hypothetical protein [Candidatus Acidoferrales bacterium]